VPEEVQPDPVPADPSTLDVGNWVHTVFWKPFIMSGQDHGNWEVVSGRLISVGKVKACYELESSHLPGNYGGIGAEGSRIRFTPLDKVFTDHEVAVKFAAKLPRPGKL